jgi:NADP-dependent 3-hydroxy acid dehydrogenase YdfG
MIETNLLGAMTATEVFLDQLRDGGGDLVNISSVAGRTAKPGSSVYKQMYKDVEAISARTWSRSSPLLSRALRACHSNEILIRPTKQPL